MTAIYLQADFEGKADELVNDINREMDAQALIDEADRRTRIDFDNRVEKDHLIDAAEKSIQDQLFHFVYGRRVI